MRPSILLAAAALATALMTALPSTACAQQETLRLAPVPLPQDARSLKRMIRNWSDGDPIPFGYHAENRPRKGMLIGGSLAFAIGYGVSVFSGATSGAVEYYVPFVGPFVVAVRVASAPCSGWFCSDTWKAIGAVVAGALGVAQLVGTALLIAGIVGKNVLVADEPGFVSVTPVYVPGGAGLAVLARF